MKKYLRRCAAFVCALLMLSEIPYARAAGPVYFAAVNETVLKLSDATMPFVSNGALYVPSDMFADKELGITYYNNVVTRSVTLYDAGRALQFDLDKRTASDGEGNPMPFMAIVRSGRVFFHAKMVAEFFGLTYTESPVAQGYVIRLRSKDSVLNDRLFLDAATSLLEYRYEEYEKEQSTVLPPVTPVTPPDTPKPPGPSTSDERTVYLSFQVTETSGQLVDVLSDRKVPATFFFTEDQLAGNAAFARRLMVMGYGIGLMADCSREAGAAEQLRLANDLLWRLTGTKTRLCVLENAGEADREAVREAGYCCLQADVDHGEKGLPEDGANDLHQTIHRRTEDAVTVWLADNAEPAGLKAFLRLANGSDDKLAVLTELVLDA